MTGRGGAQGGYVVAQTALLLIPLMIFAAMATDIGYWYVTGQQTQAATDAAALGGAVLLPDIAAAEAEARAVATRNGFEDATPGDNTDFETGPEPQVQVNVLSNDRLEVRIRRSASSFFGRVVMDGISVERYSIAEFVDELTLGNPSSAIGTGNIPQANSGVPPSLTWLAVSSYCTDKQYGDLFAPGYYSTIAEGRMCGPNAGDINPQAVAHPLHDPDAYLFAVEMQPSTGPIDIALYDPGVNCSPAVTEYTGGPRIYYRIYGPNTAKNHRQFTDSNSPIDQGLLARDACTPNSPAGDGWWNIATGLPNPGVDGGYYYVILAARSPSLPDLDPADSFWAELDNNMFSMRAAPSGGKACILSDADPGCPRLFAVEWLPFRRDISGESEFYLTEIREHHAGTRVIVQVFDTADGSDNIQIADPSGQPVNFEWRYADESVGGMMAGAFYRETTFNPTSDTCNWGGAGGNPCIDTSNAPNFDDHLYEITFDVPSNYSCGGSCWWTVRYTTGAAALDRSTWGIVNFGDPVRLAE